MQHGSSQYGGAMTIQDHIAAAVTTPTTPGGVVGHLVTHPPMVSDADLMIGAGSIGIAAILALKLATRRGGGDGATATRRQLRRMTRRAILKDVRRQWPRLEALSRAQRRELPVGEYATYLGMCPSPRMPLFVSHKDFVIMTAPPQTGKTALLGTWILDAPGFVVTTTTRLDLFKLTGEYRSQFGRIHLFNPEGLGRLDSTFRWNPVDGCENPTEAMRQAGGIITGAGKNEDVTNAGHWQSKAEEVLACYLHAAALGGHSFKTMWRWTINRGDNTPWLILSRDPRASEYWADILDKARSGADPKHTNAVYETLGRAMRFMSNPELAKITEPDAEHPALDVAAFVHSRDTLYLVAENVPGMETSALFSGLTAKIHRTAKYEASLCPGERLDPVGSFILDELALVCPVPIDDWSAHSGGSGIGLRATFQSMAQLVDRYGQDKADKTRNNSNCTLVLGGSMDPRYLREVSDLCGTYEKLMPPSETTHAGGGTSTSRQYQTRPRVTMDQIRELRQNRALVIYRNAPVTTFDYTPVWDSPQLKAFNRQRARLDRLAARAEQARAREAAATDTAGGRA